LPAEGQRCWADQFAPERFEQRLMQLLERFWGRHERRLARAAQPVPLA
jgi:hypothetical protein